MPSTQHTQACVFIKITVQNWHFSPLAIRLGTPIGVPHFSKRTTGVDVCRAAWVQK